ncbi:MAG: hypothetical protein U5N21_10695 [Rhodococcus sp. (in: high G+C Gram-positive bacteria)]|uniref:hypothetical protein n=1 Tax=Rhodococcus sp. TaxID=1831 RepID=UPI002ADBB06E|nr:hypothetical protein [Rhodococcus sp. (in: high G+C Gram-positive bacteria)]MDZ7930484.1 hypothetical protein [Rhodococcus sp. (in: high G+C Gram-positive bacteria)]
MSIHTAIHEIDSATAGQAVAAGPSPRVSGSDESYLLAEDLFGVEAPMQFAWVFDDDPGEAAIHTLCARLAAGPLHRAVRRTRVPAARHTWVRSTQVPQVYVDNEIGDDAIGDWVETAVRRSNLAPTEGRGWQLETTTTTGGRRVVSLAVSHMIADGQGVYLALAAATTPDPARPLPDPVGGVQEIRQDLLDGIGQVRAAATSVRVLFAELVRSRQQKPTAPVPPNADAQPFPKPPQQSVSTPETDSAGSDTTLINLNVDRSTWQQRAAEHNGTSNGLFTAVLADIVQASTYPIGDRLKVCIAVNRREGSTDERANASGGVWIRLDEPVTAGGDLSHIRALSKTAFTDYAESGADRAADNLQPLVRLLPGWLVGRLMRSIPGPDTTVSNLGVVPDDVLTLGGRKASWFTVRAVTMGTPAEQRRVQGPGLAAWLVEYGDRITLAFYGIHPDHFGDAAVLRDLISEELSAWDIPHTFW